MTSLRHALYSVLGSQQDRGPVVHNGDLYRYLSFSCLMCPFPRGASWDYLPNKLLALNNLSQDLLPGESQMKTPANSVIAGL